MGGTLGWCGGRWQTKKALRLQSPSLLGGMLLKLRSQQHLCFPTVSVAPHRLLSLSLLLLLLLLPVLLLSHSLLPNFPYVLVALRSC